MPRLTFPTYVILILTSSAAARKISHYSHQPTDSDSTLITILRQSAVDNTIILGEASCGFLEFAENWIMHVQQLNITNFLIIASDSASYAHLHASYPAHIIPASLFELAKDMTPGQLLPYGSKAFNQMMCKRISYQQAVLAHGYRLLWSDLDSVWLQNVLSIIPPGLDFVGADDTNGLIDAQSSANVCGCLMFWAPSKATHKAMHMWDNQCIGLNGEGDDQQAFNMLWNVGQLKKTLHWYILPQQLFPSGGLKVRVKRDNDNDLYPALIHANYLIGHEAKQAFLEERQAWKVPRGRQHSMCQPDI